MQHMRFDVNESLMNIPSKSKETNGSKIGSLCKQSNSPSVPASGLNWFALGDDTVLIVLQSFAALWACVGPAGTLYL